MTAALAAFGFILLLCTFLLIIVIADYERCQQRRHRRNLRMYADYHHQGSVVRRTLPESPRDGVTFRRRGGGRY